jgi:hypothetical protein
MLEEMSAYRARSITAEIERDNGEEDCRDSLGFQCIVFGKATRAIATFPIPWPTRVLREHASDTGAILAKRTSRRGREGGRCGAGCVQMAKVWLYFVERKRGPTSRVPKILPRHAYASLSLSISSQKQPAKTTTVANAHFMHE